MSGCIIHPYVFGQADKTRHLSTSSPKSRWSLPASGWEIHQKKNDKNPRKNGAEDLCTSLIQFQIGSQPHNEVSGNFCPTKMVPENLLLCSAPTEKAHLFGGHTGWQILRTNAPYESVSFSGHLNALALSNTGISPSFSTQSSSAPTLTSSTASRLFH